MDDLTTDQTEQFWSRVDRSADCWLWSGARTPLGYGHLRSYREGRERWLYAHRLSWHLTNGPIPEGLNVLHRCDNPPCVRPDHLYVDNQQQNCRDRSIRSTRSAGCKLFPHQVQEIGVHENTVYKLCGHHSWGWLS